MTELETEISVVTETWIVDNAGLRDRLEWFKHDEGFEVIMKNRQTGRGGSAAIVYRRGDWIMNRVKTDPRVEVVCAIGRRTSQRRKMAVIGAYIPPSANAVENEEFLNYIADLVSIVKSKYSSPDITIAGDFNHRKIDNHLKEYPELKLVHTGPTRGRNTLDLVYTNFDEHIIEAKTIEPIANQVGVMSDHLAVHVAARIPRVPK